MKMKCIRTFVKMLIPYGVMVSWLLAKYGMKIDEPLFAYGGRMKTFKRLVKFALPFGIVKFIAGCRYRMKGWKQRCVVVIPVYKKDLTSAEALSLANCLWVLRRHKVCLVCPVGLDTREYDRIAGREMDKETFAPHYFAGVTGYNDLMTANEFYGRFADFDFMLVHQLDAWVFRDALAQWCGLDFDYVGAPWFERHYDHECGVGLWCVGNGGFSLRRIARFLAATENGFATRTMKERGLWEDTLYSFGLANTPFAMRVPSPIAALDFAYERSPEFCHKVNAGRIPMGCHAWEHTQPVNFWPSLIPWRRKKPEGKKVTVITVNYNNLEGLKATADSVIAQNSDAFEWVIVDGGSMDGSAEYIRLELAQYAVYWCSERDCGVYFAMNKAVAHASGEYCIFMNSGDRFFDHAVISKFVALAPNADLAYGNAIRVCGNGETFDWKFPEGIDDRFFFRENICHQAMFVKTSVLRGSGYDTSFAYYADWARWQRLARENGTFAHLPFTVCFYDLRSGLSMRQTERHNQELLRLGIAPESVFGGGLREPWLRSMEDRLSSVRSSGRRLRVFILANGPNSSCFRYRVYNVWQALRAGDDVMAEYFFEGELPVVAALIGAGDIVVFHRFEATRRVMDFLLRMKDVGARLAFDVDDLYCKTSDLSHIYETLREFCSQEGHWPEICRQVSQMEIVASLCSALISPNAHLAARLAERFPQATSLVLPNGLNDEQVRESERIRTHKKDYVGGKEFLIGYFSGSNTHFEDLKVALPALKRIMDEYPQVCLNIVGWMTLPDEMRTYQDRGRVRMRPFVDFVTLQREYAWVDLNIAPLQDTDFTNSKSELKFYETAIVETPTLASATFAFRNAIRHGENGFLARANEWYKVLKQIIEGEFDLRKVAAVARDECLLKYHGKCYRNRVTEVFHEIARMSDDELEQEDGR